MDGRNAENVYLTFMTRHWSGMKEFVTTPDTLTILVDDGTNITEIDTVVVRYGMQWTSELVDLSQAAKGKLFKIHFRVSGENENSNYQKFLFLDDIKVETSISYGDAIPTDLILNENSNSLDIIWKEPVSELYGLTCIQTFVNDLFTNGVTPFIAVNSYDSNDIEIYRKNNLFLTSITAYIGQTISIPDTATVMKLAVFVDNQRVVSQDITNFTPNAWNTFKLDNPVDFKSVSQNIRFGIDVVEYQRNESPIGVDEDGEGIAGKGDLYSTDGGNTWLLLSDLPEQNRAKRNFCIVGDISAADHSAIRINDIVGYEIYRNGVKINNGLIIGQKFTTETVEACYSVRAYSALSRISDYSEEKCFQPSGIHNNKTDNFVIYPSPAETEFCIQANGPVISLDIYNISGTLIKSIENVTETINVSDLTSGIYVIKVKTGKENYTGKLIKK